MKRYLFVCFENQIFGDHIQLLKTIIKLDQVYTKLKYIGNCTLHNIRHDLTNCSVLIVQFSVSQSYVKCCKNTLATMCGQTCKKIRKYLGYN